MNMKQVEKQFKECYKDFIAEHKNDKIMLNLQWTFYVDGLVKDGILTQRQWQNLKNIF